MAKQVVFEDLTVAEILLYVNAHFCDAKMEYMSLGSDLRKIWEKLVTNDTHYDTFCSAIGLSDDEDELEETRDDAFEAGAKAMEKYLNNSMADTDDLISKFHDYLPNEWFKGRDFTHWSKDEKNKEFRVFSTALFDFISRRLSANPGWGLELIHRPKKLAVKVKRQGTGRYKVSIKRKR